MTPRSRTARSPSTTTVTRSRSHTTRPSAAIIRYSQSWLLFADVAADSCKANVAAVWIRKRPCAAKHPDRRAALEMAEPNLHVATTFAEGLGKKLLEHELPIFGKEIVFDVGLQRLLQTVQSH